MDLRPGEPYEQHGDVGYVFFPCGYMLAPDGDTLHLYSGAADTLSLLPLVGHVVC
jgi:predicted GH43/DUF377 family glycosyl hydrolase